MKKFIDYFMSQKDKLLPCLLLAMGYAIFLFVSVPLEIFSSNMDESYFSLSDFIGPSIFYAISILLVIFAITYFTPGKAGRIILNVFLALLIMFFIQGSFLNSLTNVVMGNGRSALNARTIIIFILDLLIWIGVFTALIIIAKKEDKKGYFRVGYIIGSALVVVTQVVSIITISATKSEIFKENATATMTSSNVTFEGFTEVSTKENIIYFVVDALDARYMEKALNKDSSLLDKFDGFTWYKDYVSLYGHTFPAITSMLTDREYYASEGRVDYLSRAYETTEVGSTIDSGDVPIKELYNAGYKVKLYSQEYYVFDSQNLPEYIANRSEGSWRVKNKFICAGNLAMFTLVRTIPSVGNYLLAPFLTSEYYNQSAKYSTKTGYKAYKYSNKAVYQYVHENAFTSTDEKVFSFIHMSGSHQIESVYNKNKKNGTKDYNGVFNSFEVIEMYIDYLKKINAYDNTTIVITGDHCFANDNFHKLLKTSLVGLLVKEPNAKGEVKTSTTQVGQKDIWPTIMNAANVTSSKYYGMQKISDYDEKENRERKHIWHTYTQGSCEEYVYQITGKSELQYENVITGFAATDNKNLDASFSDSWKIVDYKAYPRFIND